MACGLVSHIWTMCGCDILIALLWWRISGKELPRSQSKWASICPPTTPTAYYWNDQYPINELLILLLRMIVILLCHSMWGSSSIVAADGKAEDGITRKMLVWPI